MSFQFMLASSAEVVEQLKFPLMVSPKIDGVRGGTRDGILLARSLKPIPNRHTQAMFGRARFEGLDGELSVGRVTAKDVFNKSTSAVMAIAGEPLVTLNCFDLTICAANVCYANRIERMRRIILNSGADSLDVRAIEQTMVASVAELLYLEKRMLDKGYEGLVLRDPNGLYKHGRSTLREGGLLRLTRTVDSEAVVLAVVEGETNNNDKTLESKGRAKRSSHAAGKVPNGMLGSFTVRDVTTSVEFELGTGEGLTQVLRKELWLKRKKLIGKLVKYRSKAVGVKDKPRQPIWLGFRDAKDLS